MKPFFKTAAAMACGLLLTITCLAAPAAQADSYFYSTSALDTYNFARFYLSGTSIQIVRRGYQAATKPDEAHILLGDTAVLARSLDWEAEPVDTGYYGYTADWDIQQLNDGEYILSLESSAIDLTLDASGSSPWVRTTYTLASVKFVKQGSQCYFPADTGISLRYNSQLLLQLEQGNAPDDFTVLKEYYTAQQNGYLLVDIEAKTNELTAGLHSDLEKCLAIDRWITQNIAYDFDFPRTDIDDWLQAHPGDSARMEDALYAFEQGYAQCYGYARLTTLMLGYAGIDSVYIRGRSENDVSNSLSRSKISDRYSVSWNTGIPDAWFYRASDGTEIPDVYNHAWNAVNISGSWYFLDTCKGAMYGYRRTNSGDPNSAYIQLNQCYSGIHLFPSLEQLSNTHMSIRYGADGYGKKLKDA